MTRADARDTLAVMEVVTRWPALIPAIRRAGHTPVLVDEHGNLVREDFARDIVEAFEAVEASPDIQYVVQQSNHFLKEPR